MITIYYYYNDPYKHAPEGAIREETTSKSERFVKQIKINLIDSETIMVFFFFFLCYMSVFGDRVDCGKNSIFIIY